MKYVRFITIVAALAFISSGVTAAGVFVCPPEAGTPAMFRVEEMGVRVEIVDNTVATTVEELFYNDLRWEKTGSYIFPLPQGAKVVEHAAAIGPSKVPARILDATESAKVFDSLYKSINDRRFFREYGTRIAYVRYSLIISARSTRLIKFKYTETLKPKSNSDGSESYSYKFPIGILYWAPRPIGRISVEVDVKSKGRINAKAAGYPLLWSQDSLTHGTFTWQAEKVRPVADMEINYTVGAVPKDSTSTASSE